MEHLKGHASLADMILGHTIVYRSCLEMGVFKATDDDDKHYWNHELKALAEIEAACAVEIQRAAEKHTGLTFGAALTAMRDGFRVSREEWKSSDSIAVLEIVNVDFHEPYFRMGHFKKGDEPFYVIDGPGLEDMLADDWAIILPEEA